MARTPSLERRVLDVLWRGDCLSVRDVHAIVGADLAYTTIATVLDRLHAKGQVTRHKHGVAWVYKAARTRDEEIASEVAKMMQRADGAAEPLLVAFLDQVEAADPSALDRLEALLNERKARR
ncbi:MAG: BlaI/MecI/CopY family transcriptional regulator [Deltaproteobacteria bacterium]|nr:BlaI/MecI/CopY family transcriptional regulator [Deltaproteobacteria bacterium]